MVFSSLVFLWYFLPCTAALYFLLRRRRHAGNLVLLAASLVFYAWGEPRWIVLMIGSIALNYVCGILMSRKRSRVLLAFCAAANLSLLGYFKYFDFLAGIVNGILGRQAVTAAGLPLPIGISFYTFQALSYVADVYRGETKAQKNPLMLALYISFFPQLIAGPIVQYRDVSRQLSDRSITRTKVCYGIRRFTYGLGKKVIFANTFAAVADRMLSEENLPYLGTGAAWAALLFYMMQIYYDFSGYSDMAIGLGKLFGFDFAENFNYPYLAGSVREFWRRWHISLSNWFKQYVYIPLGGNRKGTLRTYRNLFLVFLATGLWHGAGWNFLLWGAYYGVFIVLERAFPGRRLKEDSASVPGHIYTLAVVFIGWSIFRIEDAGQLLQLWRAMIPGQGGVMRASMFADRRAWTLMAAALILCGPLQRLCPALRKALYRDDAVSFANAAAVVVILAVCTVLLICNTYNPFIYFRF